MMPRSAAATAFARGGSFPQSARRGLTSVDDVRAHTKASASCGTCSGLVEQLLALSLGNAYDPASVKPMCGCTDLGHADVRRLIVAKELKTIPELMQELEWKSSGGLRQMPSGAQLLHARYMAGRICR